jgi:DNA-binding protein YbaB
MHDYRRYRILKKILTILICIIIGAAIAAGGIYYMQLKAQPKVDAKGLMERLEDASELTVAKSFYTGIVRFSEGTIPLINKNGFTMKYEAEIDAGFDLEQVSIEVTDDEVIVTVPPAEIQSISIDPDSLEFYDNKTSIIKTDRKEATKEALKEAQKDAEEKASAKGLLEEAEKRAEVIFKGILDGGVGERQIVVVKKGSSDNQQQ